MKHLLNPLYALALILAGCEQPTPRRPAAPTWTAWPPLRDAGNLGPVVTDIESHLPAGNPYRARDRVNWVHEGTQGIAGRLRDRFHRPGFYVLDNRAVLMHEAGTLAAVAAAVPPSLRGPGYQLYLVSQQGYFGKQPTYVFDEWVAYTNGSAARLALKISDRTETVASMIEFVPYALCVPYATRSRDPQMQRFIAWQVERVLALHAESQIPCSTLDTLRTAADADRLRQFARRYFGPSWTRQTWDSNRCSLSKSNCTQP